MHRTVVRNPRAVVTPRQGATRAAGRCSSVAIRSSAFSCALFPTSPLLANRGRRRRCGRQLKGPHACTRLPCSAACPPALRPSFGVLLSSAPRVGHLVLSCQNARVKPVKCTAAAAMAAGEGHACPPWPVIPPVLVFVGYGACRSVRFRINLDHLGICNVHWNLARVSFF